MNLNATPETIRAVAEAMQLAQLLDDRTAHADKARIAAWAEEVEPFQLDRGDLLDAVRMFYADPRDRAIGVGDLIGLARSIRRDRNEREDDAERKARESAWDAELMARNQERLSDMVSPVAAAKALPPLKFVRQSHRNDDRPNPLAVRCPWCRSAEFRPCQIPNTSVTMREPHPSRVEAVTGVRGA
jgi:hypothetical protein